MPQIFKIGAYLVYFWANEGIPLEPIHVHVSTGTPSANSTKIWITKAGRCIKSGLIFLEKFITIVNRRLNFRRCQPCHLSDFINRHVSSQKVFREYNGLLPFHAYPLVYLKWIDFMRPHTYNNR